MPNKIKILLCFVIIQAYVKATENNPSNLGTAAALEEGIKIENTQEIKGENIEDKGDGQQRQKRYFEYGFESGVTSFNPILPNYPGYIKRDNTQNVGIYGTGNLSENTLAQIYKRLQELANLTKRQYLPPDPPRPVISIPTFIPYNVYVPGTGCGCKSPSNPPQSVPHAPQARPDPPQETPNSPQPPQNYPTTISNNEQPTVDLNSRIGGDSNESNKINKPEGDGSRPISFIPVSPKRPLKKPPPPVEHGSVQAGAQPSVTRNPNDFFDSPLLSRPESQTLKPLPPKAHAPAGGNNVATITPTPCDAAVISCCHQSPITKDCFSSKGCIDPSIHADPCNKQLLLNVVSKYQEIYKIRGG